PPGIAIGVYPFTVHATSGVLSHTSDATFTVSSSTVSLPGGWRSIAIGTTDPANQASYASGVFTVNSSTEGNGNIGIEWYYDTFEFAYMPMVGDATIVARIAQDGAFQAGVML